MHRCPMIIVFEPLVHPGPHSVRSCFSHVQALGFRDGRFQLSLSFRRCSAQHVLVDGPARLRIAAGSVPALPAAVLPFAEVSLPVGPSFCHGLLPPLQQHSIPQKGRNSQANDAELTEHYHLPFLCYSVSFSVQREKPYLCFMRRRICVSRRGRMPLAQTPPQRRLKRPEPAENTGLLKLTTT